MRITGSDFTRFHDAWQASPVSRGLVFDTPDRSYVSVRDGDGGWSVDPDRLYDLGDLGTIRSTEIPRMLVVDTEAVVRGWLRHLSPDGAWHEPVPDAPAEVVRSTHDGDAVEVRTPVDDIRRFVAANPRCKGTSILDHLAGLHPDLDRKAAQRMVSRTREQGLIVKGEGGTWSVDDPSSTR